jgi:hypothetical protein
MDWGRSLLLFFDDTLAFAGETPSFNEASSPSGDFKGSSLGRGVLISMDFDLCGLFSELSPITASCPPSSCAACFPSDFEPVSRDQKAQVEPAFGADCFGGSFVTSSTGGASFMITSSGSFAASAGSFPCATACGGLVACAVSVALLDHSPNQELLEAVAWRLGGGFLPGGPVAAGASWASGEVSCRGSSTSISLGNTFNAVVSVVAGVVAGCASAEVPVDRPSHPSQPDEVAGRCGVSAAGGSGLGVSASVATASFTPSTFPFSALSVFFVVPLLATGLGTSVCASNGRSFCAAATGGPLRPLSSS